MDVNLKETWIVSVDTSELRLILKALGGRLKPEEVDNAKSLGDTLTRIRANVSKAKIKVADRLLNDVENTQGADNDLL